MKNFIFGLAFGAFSLTTAVALGWNPVASPSTREANPTPTLVSDDAQVRQDTNAPIEGSTPISINEGFIAGRIMQLDRDRRRILVQSPNQRLVELDITPNTKIRFRDRQGSFSDLEVSQPIKAGYFSFGRTNKCSWIRVYY